MPTFWHYKVFTIVSVDQCTSFFGACSQQSSMASLSSRSSVGYAEGLQPFCTQIVLAVHLRRATLWQSLIMSMCHMRTEPRLDWLPLLPPWHEPLPKSARGANQNPRSVAEAIYCPSFMTSVNHMVGHGVLSLLIHQNPQTPSTHSPVPTLLRRRSSASASSSSWTLLGDLGTTWFRKRSPWPSMFGHQQWGG